MYISSFFVEIPLKRDSFKSHFSGYMVIGHEIIHHLVWGGGGGENFGCTTVFLVVGTAPKKAYNLGYSSQYQHHCLSKLKNLNN